MHADSSAHLYTTCAVHLRSYMHKCACYWPSHLLNRLIIFILCLQPFGGSNRFLLCLRSILLHSTLYNTYPVCLFHSVQLTRDTQPDRTLSSWQLKDFCSVDCWTIVGKTPTNGFYTEFYQRSNRIIGSEFVVALLSRQLSCLSLHCSVTHRLSQSYDKHVLGFFRCVKQGICSLRCLH